MSKYAQLESNAIKRFRESLRSELYSAIQPIVQRRLGQTNSGTIANDAIDAITSKYGPTIDRSAVEQMAERLEYLMALVAEGGG